MNIDNEDKQKWCTIGEELEKDFVKNNSFYGCAVLLNKEKETNKFANDLTLVLRADLKTITTPFFTANRYGIDSEYAITINKKDIERYKKLYPNIFLILDVKYKSFTGVKICSIKTLCKLVDEGKAKEHFYINRVNDTKGNAKSSYIFDLRWFDDLTKEI